MSVEDILSALYPDPQAATALDVSPGGLYQNLGQAPSAAVVSGLANDQTTTATPVITNITSLLTQIYGYNPFLGQQRKGKYGGENASAHAGTPLIGVPPQFAQAVVEEMLRHQQDITDADLLTQRIQQYWNSPQVKSLYGLLQSQGASVGTINSSLANVVKYGNEQVPLPFDAQFIGNVTQGFGENGEVGVDIGMGVGNTLRAPMAGTVVEVQKYGPNSPWNYVRIQLDNGWSYAIGHLSYLNVYQGQRVNPGNLLGTSGGVAGVDTAPGHTSGPHIEFQLLDPKGNHVNPYPFLQSLFKGTTFGTQMAQFGTGIYGSGVSVAQQRLMQQGIFDPELHQFYERANTVFRTYFGREPNDQELLDIVAHGKDESSIESYVRSMPSHIAGVAMGDYTDLHKLANHESQRIYGHDAPDSIIKSLFDSQAMTPSAVQFYYSQLPFQPGKDVSPILYDQVYKSSAAYTRAVWNQEPHPADLKAIYDAAGGQPTTAPAPSDTKASLNAA